MFSICSATYIKVLVKSLGLVLRSYLVTSFATVLLCGAVWFGCMVFLYLELFWGLLPFPKNQVQGNSGASYAGEYGIPNAPGDQVP